MVYLFCCSVTIPKKRSILNICHVLLTIWEKLMKNAAYIQCVLSSSNKEKISNGFEDKWVGLEKSYTEWTNPVS